MAFQSPRRGEPEARRARLSTHREMIGLRQSRPDIDCQCPGAHLARQPFQDNCHLRATGCPVGKDSRGLYPTWCCATYLCDGS